MNLVEMLEPTEGEDCQWLGVYVTRWQREWGEPSVMFRGVDAAAIANMPEVKALVDAARAANTLDSLWNRLPADARPRLKRALDNLALALKPFEGGDE